LDIAKSLSNSNLNTVSRAGEFDSWSKAEVPVIAELVLLARDLQTVSQVLTRLQDV
jgi:hypothetical protein